MHEGPTNKVPRKAVIAQNSHKSEGMCARAQEQRPHRQVHTYAIKSLSVTGHRLHCQLCRSDEGEKTDLRMAHLLLMWMLATVK